MSALCQPPSKAADFYFPSPIWSQPPPFELERTDHQTLIKGYHWSTTYHQKVAKQPRKLLPLFTFFYNDLANTTTINQLPSMSSTFLIIPHYQSMNRSPESKPTQNCRLSLQVLAKTPPFRTNYHHNHTHQP